MHLPRSLALLRHLSPKLTTLSLLACTFAPAPICAQASDARSDDAPEVQKTVKPEKRKSLWRQWEDRATRTQAGQPSWPVPLVSPFPMLAQVYRSDFTRQITSAGTPTWSYGAGKGFNLIPGFNTQIDIYPPPYVQRNNPASPDGWGDVGLLYKYRIVARPEAKGNYIVSAQLGASFPTGEHRNGAKYATVSPTVLAGKGFGRRWEAMSSVGATLPTSEGRTEGRTVHFNTVAQFRATKLITAELEDNATFFHGGANDGRMQNFLTPGILLGRVKFFPGDAKSRTGLVFGAGMQFATSGWHSYDHNIVTSIRLAF